MPTSGVRVLTFGSPVPLPKDYETLHVRDTAGLMSAVARFQPDVIVTEGVLPGPLKTAAFEIRKRWINVPKGSKPEAVVAAIEGCHSFNLWSEHPNDKAQPLVSVYTGTKNSGDYLEEAYQSLKDQKYKNWEWLVVDDHSDDGTWERLEAYARTDVRVRPWRSGKPLGRVGAVKDAATRLSRGAYLVELDHDDMLTDFALEEIRSAFDRDPGVGMVYSNFAAFFEDGSPHSYEAVDEFWKGRYRWTEYRGKRWYECVAPDVYDRFGPHFTQRFAWFLTVGPNHVRAFRASVLRELGGYNRNLPVADDWDLYVRFFMRSRCLRIDKLLYLYRFRDGYANLTFKRNKAIQDHLALARARHAKEFEEADARLSSDPERPCFVLASRTEAEAAAARAALSGEDVFVKVGAASILEAYEEGRQRWAGRRRIIYLHDDVEIRDLGAFMAAVRGLPDGLHGLGGSAAPGAADRAAWWDAPPLRGRYVQKFPDHSKEVEFEESGSAHEAFWLDGMCLVSVGQRWSWKVPGKPAVWHGYDWLACKRTRAEGGRCFVMAQPAGAFVSHRGYGRTAEYERSLELLRILARPAEERRDHPNIKAHLPVLVREAKGVVLELGSREGASTAALLAGVEERGGEVWSVDVDPTAASAWKGHPLWRFVQCDSIDAPALSRAGFPDRIDVLFVDSEHTYERASSELRTWLPRVRPGGVVLMHDTEEFPGVKKALEEAAKAAGLVPEFLTDSYGLGILRIPPDCSEISFVVLDATGSPRAERCLASVRAHAADSEVVLVGNGAVPSPEARALADKVVLLESNIGFAAGANRGAVEASRRLVCFLNDDAAFVDGTPARLAAAVSQERPIVAPYSNRAKPPQGDVPKGSVPAKDEIPEAVVGLCMMMPVALFRSLGGFDTRLLTYEDDDLCLRAARLGKGCRVVGGTWVDHERHATFKALGLDPAAVMRSNAAKFRALRPRIRVVAIAKDEEAALPGFLEQFRPLTRDWCVLDTGSADRTVDAARAAGASTLSAKFKDFAAARNQALASFAEGTDWIVMLDPDERLDAHTIEHLEAVLASTPHDVLLAPLEAVERDGARRRFVPKPFCFRTKPELRWVFKVHEKLVGSLRQAIVVNAAVEHLIVLHSPERRAASEDLYRRLAAEEPYFTDAGFRARMREEWPILDYDRTDDPRIAKIHVGPLVSAVVPTCRRPDLLRKAVASALGQAYANLEVVVVGDACPDLASVRFEDPRVKILNLPTNHGAGGAVPRNYGIMLAAGGLLAYLDDDCMWKPDHVSSLYEALRAAGSDAAFAMSSMEVRGKDLGFREPAQGSIDTSCILHRKSLVQKYGWWKPREGEGAVYWHDWEIVSRWLAGRERWAATERPTLVYGFDTCGQKEYLEARLNALSKT